MSLAASADGHYGWQVRVMTLTAILDGNLDGYHFRSTPYTAKATDAVKLFGPRFLSDAGSSTCFKLGREFCLVAIIIFTLHQSGPFSQILSQVQNQRVRAQK